MQHIPRLIGLKSSPFTWRAKWALRHHLVEYSYREYMVLLDEPYLKWQARKWNTTVPLLVTPQKKRMMDSIGIARYADQVGKGSPLFPQSLNAQFDSILNLCERLINADRGLFCIRVLKKPKALEEYIPWKLPDSMIPVGREVTAFGIRYIGWAFHIHQNEEARYLGQLQQAMSEIEVLFKKNQSLGGIAGEYSFADLSIAASLKMMKPELFPEINERYQAILEWGKNIQSRYE